MYNIQSNTYTTDKRKFYFPIGVIGGSLIGYTAQSHPIADFSNQMLVQVEESYSQIESELTKHAMNLAQTSLAEDWDDESNEHWESFL
jgi:hypothetical protein